MIKQFISSLLLLFLQYGLHKGPFECGRLKSIMSYIIIYIVYLSLDAAGHWYLMKSQPETSDS